MIIMGEGAISKATQKLSEKHFHGRSNKELWLDYCPPVSRVRGHSNITEQKIFRF